MNILTQEIASKNIGKYIDCYKRLFGYYPMKIITIGKQLYVKDVTGTCMPISEKEDFNSHRYDYIFKMEIVENE